MHGQQGEGYHRHKEDFKTNLPKNPLRNYSPAILRKSASPTSFEKSGLFFAALLYPEFNSTAFFSEFRASSFLESNAWAHALLNHTASKSGFIFKAISYAVFCLKKNIKS